MKNPKMSRELQKWLRDFLRTEFPSLVKPATFYYQVPGIKFWGCAPKKSSKALQEEISKRLDEKLGLTASQLRVYVGGNDSWFTLYVVKILDADAPDPQLAPFKRPLNTKHIPAVHDHRGFERNPVSVPTVPVPTTTLRKWKQTLDHLGEEITRHDLGEIKAITAEMQKILTR